MQKNPAAVALGKRTLKKYGRKHFARIGALRGRTFSPCEAPSNPRRSQSHQFRNDICAYCKKHRSEVTLAK